MKIYEIGTGYTPIPAQMGAATEIVVEELTRSFLKLGENVEIIDIAADSRAETDLPISEVRVPKFIRKKDVSLGLMHKVKRVVYSVKLALALKKILKKSNEKVILHFHNQYNMFFFLKLVGKKYREKATILYTNHSYVWHGEWDEIKDTIDSRYFQEVASMKEADFIFVLNEQTKKNIVEHIGINNSKVYLIDNGVNTDTYRKLPEAEIEALKEQYNIKGKKAFVQVGSVCDRKNQLTSIKLLLPLMKADENVVFLYAGGIISEEYQQQIADFAKENSLQDRVIYCGELSPGEELNRFYNLGSAMLFPSKAEGFSLVILEAMSAGVPVFVYENLLFKLSDKCLRFKDEADFERIMNERILTQGREELSREVRQAVLENYGWDKVASDYRDIASLR
ncbi:MAG: glycosyltransferase family 4 protein [Ruminococcus sp.]|nr:glycosyltransferase family 4 protein [Ruminococcus sp.]